MPDETFMPAGSSAFTQGLFDTTALSPWTHHAPSTVCGSYDADPEDGDDDDTDLDAPSGPAESPVRGSNFHLDDDRNLSRGWPARARDNIAAITLSKELEESGRAPTTDEQAQLLRFIGFGATELAQNCFRRPGETEFRPDWQEIGAALEAAVTPEEYAALQRATQYAHYTPETIIRALWRTAERLGFTGGRVLEPGMGTGLFFALLPEALNRACQLTGIEYDPVTARIARFVHPEARVRCEDYARSNLSGRFDLAIGNPPFSDRVVRADPVTRALGLRLHDYFIARSIARLRPGGIALFVTSTGTMDKAGTTAREHIADIADLIGAVRLPEGSMRASAGTDVVIDLLVFQRRADGQPPAGEAWINLAPVARAVTDTDDEADDSDNPVPSTIHVNRYFAEHPEMVLGEHALKRGIYGSAQTYSCLPRKGGADLEHLLTEALDRLPDSIVIARDESQADTDDDAGTARAGTAADGATIKEGSYLLGESGQLMQILDGEARSVAIREGKGSGGILARDAKIIRALLPVRDAVREVLRAQAADQPWAQAQIRLRVAYSGFVRAFGPVNHTLVSVMIDAETEEERETHRRPNLSPFADDPDCWLVASIEDYDLESGLARMGPIFRERVIAPPATPLIATATDALAVTLNETGRVDIDHLAELLDSDPETVLAQLGETVFRNPSTESWETDDAYLAGSVRTKLALAQAAAERDPHYERNVAALRLVQPEDLRPSDITARLGAPWIPAADIETFVAEVMSTQTQVWHSVEIAAWSVETAPFAYSAAGTSEWGTARRNAGLLLHDALNNATPQIFDTIMEDGVEKRVLNSEATEAAKEKLARIKEAFTGWIWTDPDRTDRLARVYNDRFNNLVPRHFDGRHLTLPGASPIIRLYDHQKRVIWRIVASGATYIAHTVGAGKSYAIAGAIMEQKRLGLIAKAMLVVPGHCLAQVSREFLQLYPAARILVADETNFVKEKRSRFLARAAAANWDAVIITHAAFRFIPVPSGFEREMTLLQGSVIGGRGLCRLGEPPLCLRNPTVPFKANQDRRHHIPKQRHQVTNWPAYDAALRQRGSLTVWFTEAAIAAWRAERRTTPGGQPHYSALAITTALTLRAVFRLALRQTEGLIGSIIRLLGLDLAVPDHSTLSRRAEMLHVLRPPSGTEPVHLLVDSTGLRLCGPGEWLVEKHGARTRRSWKKLHLGVDADTGEIVAAALTSNDVDDSSQVGPLLDQVGRPVASFTGDGAFDRDDVYDEVAARHPDAPIIVPPRSSAVPSGTADIAPTKRDEHLRLIAENGRMGWQKASGYNYRALVEADISRYKRVIGGALRSSTDARRATEVAVAIRALNRMLEFGRPEYVRLA